MSITYGGDTIVDSNGGVFRPSSSVMRNRIINGAMVIDQRNAGASVTVTTDGQYTLDRFRISQSQNSKLTVQQSTTAPTGFANSLLVTVASAVTPSGSDYFGLLQPIEGYNVADLGFGTANAKTITLSFWVRSSLTGTFSGMLYNNAANRSYCFTYTINAANTMEYKTITIVGDTSGTWTTNNTTGLAVYWDLGSGTNTGTSDSWQSTIVRRTSSSVQLIATAGATFYITGVQLEVGSSATGFEYRQYGTELANCQRYYLQSGGGAYAPIFGAFGTCVSTTIATMYFPLPVSMRASPTLTYTGTPRLDNGQGGFNISAITGGIVSTNLATGSLSVTSSGLTVYQPVKIDGNAGGSIVSFSAEL